jgi:glycosyltransferase involved in cell wall biosynthesis
MEELCVVGHPSYLGGADTELNHQILCWLAMGKKVHICHTGELDNNCLAMGLEARGCVYHTPREWSSLEGFDCISFCNSEFLKELPEIVKYARSTTFVNCMTFNFEAEVEMQKRGMIDFHLYQTRHAFDRVSKRLQDGNVYRPLMFQPYFHSEHFPYHDRRPSDHFRFGRISRPDPAKFHRSQLWIYETMTSPMPKAGLVMGWSEEVQRKFGRNAEPYIATVSVGWISSSEFYRFCDAVIMTTDTYENLPRVGFEAMASGSVLVVDRRGGWESLVDSGKTGWLCENERDFVYRASRLAHEVGERESFRIAAKEKLDREWGMQAAMDSWDRIFKEWDKL